MRWDYMFGGSWWKKDWFNENDTPFKITKKLDPSYIGQGERDQLILKTWCEWHGEYKVCGSIKVEAKDIFRPDRLFALSFNLKARISNDGSAKIRIGNGELEGTFVFTSKTVTFNGIDLRVNPTQFTVFNAFQEYKERVELDVNREHKFNRPILKPSTYNGISIEVSGNAEIELWYLNFCVDYVHCRLVPVGDPNEKTCTVMQFVFAQKIEEKIVTHTIEADQFGNWVEFGDGLSIHKPQVQLVKGASGEVVASFRRNQSKEPLEIVGGYVQLSGDKHGYKKMPWTKMVSLTKAQVTKIEWDTVHTYDGFEDVVERTDTMPGVVMNDKIDSERKGSVTLSFEVDCVVRDNPPIPDEPEGNYDFYIELFWTIPDERVLESSPAYPFVDLDLWAVSGKEVDGKYVYDRASLIDFTTIDQRGNDERDVVMGDWLKMSLVKDNRKTHKLGEDIGRAWSSYGEMITVKGNYGRILTVGVANYAAPENYAKAENVLYLREYRGVKIQIEVWDKKKREQKGRIVINPEQLYQQGADRGCILPVFNITIDENKEITVDTNPTGTIPLPIYSDEFRNSLDDKLGH